jgi:hypothetical protein
MNSLKLKYAVVTALLFLALAVSMERPAYAYVDPGSSLLLFQSVSAVVTGMLFYFRRRLKSMLGRLSGSSTSVSEK